MSGRCYDHISRHGLTEVYRPNKDGGKPVAHIIFVHGLFGHPEKTWTGIGFSSKTAQRAHSPQSPKSAHSSGVLEKENGKAVEPVGSGRPDPVFWPAALLPKVVPNTRIWAWGYDADIDGFWSSASQNTVSQHAINLLSDIADLLESKDCNLPVIFVVHSLGGLIIKAAMNMSSETRGNRLKVVVPTVRGVLFLGTPHRGSKSASIGRIAYQITKAAARRPNEKLLQALERNSDTLDQINSSFLQTIEENKNIAVSSFREEKETRKFLFFSTIVVEADSARIGLAREELNSIPANHRDMAKLSSFEDVGFKRVSAQIRRWIQSMPMPSDDHGDEEYIDCVRSLDSPATKTRLKNVANSHSETLKWLFDTDIVNFSSWLQDSSDSLGPIYWIQGKPGSGKSTLMKFAMMDPRLSDLLQTSEHLPYVIAGFFFHDRGILVQKSISGMLQELLHSILLQCSALRQFVQPAYTALVEAQKTKLPTWDLESLQLTFEAIIKQRQVTTRLCLFLDALDEHHGDNDHLANLMKKLIALADGDIVKVKLCLASRPWDTFVISFSKYPGFKIHDHTHNDIRLYTLSEFQQSSPSGVENPSARNKRSAKLEALAAQVTEKAHGVFIWVRIVVEEIIKGLRARTPFFVLQEKLAKMPEELKDLYEHTLDRIEPDHADEAYVMLQVALCALSPLLLETFVNVTSDAVWHKLPGIGEESIEDMTQRVVGRSGGLLEIIESTPADRSTALAPSNCDTTAPSEQISVDFDKPSGEAYKEDSKAEHVYVTRQVQFIHQTAKEYIQGRKDNFGLKRTQTGGSGFHYILGAAVSFNDEWADEIGLDLFEYARLANLDKTIESQNNLYHCLHELSRKYSNPVDHRDLIISDNLPGEARVDWWLAHKQIDFYRLFFAKRETPFEKVTGLALATGLFEFVENRLRDGFTETAIIYRTALILVATIGSKITSVQTSRRKMLDVLYKHGVPIDSYVSFADQLRQSPLATIIQTKGRFEQDDTERVSAIAWLLDHGANPNLDMNGRRNGASKNYNHGDSLFFQCIRQESVEIVRLLGQYGAILPAEMITPVRILWQMLSTPTAVLEEVIRIMRRNYPDVDFDDESTFDERADRVPTREIFWDDERAGRVPIREIFWNDDTSAAAPILGAVAGVSVGLSRIFAREYSALGKKRQDMHRYQALRLREALSLPQGLSLLERTAK